MLVACRLAGLSALILDYGGGGAGAQFPKSRSRSVVWHVEPSGDAAILTRVRLTGDRPNVLRYWGLGYGRGGGAPLANAGFTATL